MQFQTVQHEAPYAFKDVVKPYEVIEPIVEVGDSVEIVGVWVEPVIGEVKEVGSMLWVDVPVATAGRYWVGGVHRVSKIWLNKSLAWERNA